MDTIKSAYAAASAWVATATSWVDGNPKKAVLAAFGLGFGVGFIF